MYCWYLWNVQVQLSVTSVAFLFWPMKCLILYIIHYISQMSRYRHSLYWSDFSTSIYEKGNFNCLLLFQSFWWSACKSWIYKLRKISLIYLETETIFIRAFTFAIYEKFSPNYAELFSVFVCSVDCSSLICEFENLFGHVQTCEQCLH